MADELNLETGDEARADAASRREQRRQRRAAGEAPKKDKPKTDTSSDSNLVSRIVTALEKVAEQLDAREDEELATAVREESQPMAQGLVSLTRHVPFLRMPLTIFMELLEPVLAFFRVGRILFYRYMSRRQAIMEQEQEQAEPAAVFS